MSPVCAREWREETTHSTPAPPCAGTVARAGWWKEPSLSSGGIGSTGVGRTVCEGENGRNAKGEMVWQIFDKQIVGV